jgi:hypothetical protein
VISKFIPFSWNEIRMYNNLFYRFVGVGLLSAIFGGLVLMDLNVLYAGLKEFFKLICDNPNPQSPQSTETPVETNC